MSSNEALFAVTLVAVDRALAQGIPIPDHLDEAITRAAKSQESYERAMFQAVEDRYNGEPNDSEFMALIGAVDFGATPPRHARRDPTICARCVKAVRASARS